MTTPKRAFSRRSLFAAGSGIAALTLAGCGGSGGDGPQEENGVTKISIGASPKPHAEILQFVKDNLAADAGLELDIVSYSDYQIPNQALNDGDIDANYYQSPNFLKSQEEEKGYDFYAFEGIHVEPMGIYSESVASIEEIADGSECAIASDPANRGRGLKLFEQAGLITLTEGKDSSEITTSDIVDNPKNLSFTELESAQIPRSLGDFAVASVNGNYALEAGLKPSDDALELEEATNSPYANMMVCREGDQDNAGLKKLEELLHSDDVRTFIEDTYTDGSVLPAF